MANIVARIAALRHAVPKRIHHHARTVHVRSVHSARYHLPGS